VADEPTTDGESLARLAAELAARDGHQYLAGRTIRRVLRW